MFTISKSKESGGESAYGILDLKQGIQDGLWEECSNGIHMSISIQVKGFENWKSMTLHNMNFFSNFNFGG